jgi:UDP-2-acetamido-3-amino-2,3-dideoxy-glucuronate N-acetyltransferase
VVTKTVPDYTLVVGNPARQIGWMSEYGHRLSFNDAGVAFCLKVEKNIAIENDKVVKL